jgi:predicted 2-oxoglutarate/Fe(II)-dependent dioxygenase YbiX
MPPGILVTSLAKHYNWQQLAEQLLRCADNRELGVMDARKAVSQHTMRVTTLVDPGHWASQVAELVQAVYRGKIEPFYQRELRWFEAPQVLRYKPGGYYRPHADADGLNAAGDAWERNLDRHLSLLIYLNENFEGGHLSFPNFNFRLRPQAGMVVAFPSDWRYLHGAMPVTAGLRHAIVSWAAVWDEPLVRSTPPRDAVLIDRHPIAQSTRG